MIPIDIDGITMNLNTFNAFSTLLTHKLYKQSQLIDIDSELWLLVSVKELKKTLFLVWISSYFE